MDFGHTDPESLEIDYIQAWKYPEPFVFLKNLLAETLEKLNKNSSDYPYDAIFNSVLTRGLIIAAHELEIDIEVRYKWEVIDTSSIATHSMHGMPVAVDININDESRGFAIDGTHLNMEIMAISYDKIFYVGHGEKNPHRNVR